jgi:hypothetical protein
MYEVTESQCLKNVMNFWSKQSEAGPYRIYLVLENFLGKFQAKASPTVVINRLKLLYAIRSNVYYHLYDVPIPSEVVMVCHQR